MAGAMDWELAAAAAQAGALGSLPCAMLDADQVREQLGKIRAHTTKPINLGFFCHAQPVLNNQREARWRERLAPYYRELEIDPAAPVPSSNRSAFDGTFCEVVEELKPEVVSFHFGLPEPALLRRVKAAGCVIISSATTVAEARWLEGRGVDAVIAQGYEAGGHRGIFLGDDIADASRHFRACSANRRCREGSGHRRRRRRRCARYRGGVRARRRRRADRLRLSLVPRSEDFEAASRRAQNRGRTGHRFDQSDDRPPGARDHQPGDARDRSDVGRGARVSPRRRRARTVACEGGSEGIR